MSDFVVAVPRPAPACPGASALGLAGRALEVLAAAQGLWPPRLGDARPADIGRGFAEGVAAADAAADAGVALTLADPPREPRGGLVAAAVLLGLDPVAAVGTRPSPDWAAQVVAVRDGARACAGEVGDPATLLARVDDPLLSWLVGFLIQSAVRGTAAIVGGGAATAALVASRMAPGAAVWWLAADVPATPAGRMALAELGLPALLDLGLSGPGGALLAHALLRGAVELLPVEDRDA